jgi:hypothetical protein
MKYYTLSLIAVLLLITSCKKKSSDDDPVLTILSPLPNSTYVSGDSLRVTVYAIDNVDLHEMKVELLDGSTALVAAYPYVHAKKSYTLDTLVYLHTVTTPKTLTVRAEAKDHDNNKGSAEVYIQVNP